METEWDLRTILTFIASLVAVIAVAWFLVWGIGKSVIVNGQSMQPTLDNGDTVIVDRLTYAIRYPERHDVIAYYNEAVNAIDIDDLDKDEVVPEISIKRIIGLPGETVQIIDGRVYINGKILDDGKGHSIIPVAGLAEDPITLKDDEYFVIGDNSKASEDSRLERVGNISRNRILGRVWLTTKPANKIGKVK